MWKTKFGRCIFVSPSGYKVYQNSFYRWLTLGNEALQTVISRHKPYKPVLHYLPALTLTARAFPDSCCLLGLGGGGIPLMLNKLSPNLRLDVVDSSQEVIEIAQKYFILAPLENVNIIHQKAEDFVVETEVTYQNLIIDLYGINDFPKECLNENFFYSCKQRLSAKGYLSINLANKNEQSPIFQIIKKQFKNILVIPIKKCTNIVVIASNYGTKDFFLDKLSKQTEIKKIFWVEKWGYVAEFG